MQDKSSYCSFPPCLDVNLIAVFQLTGHHAELNSHPHQKSHFTYTTRFLETQTAIFIISHDTSVAWFSDITGTMAPKLRLTPLPCTGTSCPPAPTSCIPGAQRHTHTQPGHSSEVETKKKKKEKTMRRGKKEGVQMQHWLLHHELMFSPSQARPQEAAACEFPFLPCRTAVL